MMKRQKKSMEFARCLVVFISTFLLFSSCGNQPKVLFEERHAFAGGNWDYEHRVVNYKAKLEASPNPHQVVLELEHDQKDPRFFPLTMTIQSPEGESSARRVNVDLEANPQGAPSVTTVVVYPQKYFNSSGEYEFKVLRKWDKYDFYGNLSLTLKIIKLPLEE